VRPVMGLASMSASGPGLFIPPAIGADRNVVLGKLCLRACRPSYSPILLGFGRKRQGGRFQRRISRGRGHDRRRGRVLIHLAPIQRDRRRLSSAPRLFGQEEGCRSCRRRGGEYCERNVKWREPGHRNASGRDGRSDGGLQVTIGPSCQVKGMKPSSPPWFCRWPGPIGLRKELESFSFRRLPSSIRVRFVHERQGQFMKRGEAGGWT